MIAFRTVIFQADMNYGGHIISEEATKGVVKNFKKVDLMLGDTKIKIGVLDKLEYNEKTKEVTATIILKADLNVNFNNKQAIVIPEGKRILETEITKAMFLL